MKLHSLTAILALGAVVSLAACSSPPKPEAPAMAPVVAPPPAPVASDPTTNQASHSLVMQVQTELKSAHLYPGKVDGAWGPHTMRGVAKFQKMHEMPANGMLDDATLKAMNLQAAPAGTAPMAPATDAAPAPAPSDSSAPSDSGQP
jgi:peptidoglycan hydrolase-like protein with peptidoglycan-binding domain